MPEYFDISFISKKNECNKESMEQFLIEHFSLYSGENNRDSIFNKDSYPELAGKEIIVGIYEYEEVDFIEFSISIPEYAFHKEKLEEELKPIDDFIQYCLNLNKKIEYVICSYEMNSYHLSQVTSIREFTPEFLSKFPLAYTRNSKNLQSVRIINLKAQDIFV